MKITCTVKEFGILVRGCEKCDCWRCPLANICDADKERGIEKFISAENVIDDAPADVLHEFLKERGVSDG